MLLALLPPHCSTTAGGHLYYSIVGQWCLDTGECQLQQACLCGTSGLPSNKIAPVTSGCCLTARSAAGEYVDKTKNGWPLRKLEKFDPAQVTHLAFFTTKVPTLPPGTPS